MQEVFVKVFRTELPGEPVFLAWFYRLILNTGRDQGRRRKTRFGLLDRLQRVGGPKSEAAPADPADPAVRRALAGLAPELRECVALRFYADLPLEQIAAAQEVPVGTVKSRLHTAMARLRTALLEAGYDHVVTSDD